MLEGYIVVLVAHMLLAIASPALLSVRVWHGVRGQELSARWLRVTPPLVDGLLILAGLALAWIIGEYPFGNTWLTAKLLALVAYIGAGQVALRRARTVRGKLSAWLIALALLLYIFTVAITRDAAVGIR